MWLRAPCGWQKVQPKGQGWPLQALRNTPGEMKHPDYKHLQDAKLLGHQLGPAHSAKEGSSVTASRRRPWVRAHPALPSELLFLLAGAQVAADLPEQIS